MASRLKGGYLGGSSLIRLNNYDRWGAFEKTRSSLLSPKKQRQLRKLDSNAEIVQNEAKTRYEKRSTSVRGPA